MNDLDPDYELAQLPAVVDLLLNDLVPEEIREGVEEALRAVTEILAVDGAEAGAAEALALLAAEGRDQEVARSERVIAALEELQARDTVRWQATTALLSRSDGSVTADELAQAFEITGPLASADAFDEFMRDDSLSLVLGESPAESVADHAERLSRVAKPAPALATVGDWAPAALRPSGAGDWVVTSEGAVGVLLGDGTWVTVDGETYLREKAPDVAVAQPLEIRRLASGQAPMLQPQVVAALASARAARSSSAHEAISLPAALALDLDVPLEDPRTILDLLREAWAVLKTARGPESAVAPLLRLAFEITRVTPTLGIPTEQCGPAPVIDLGRVRWCTLSQRAVFWIPMSSDHPDAVGGADRPWTTDIPSAAATWLGASPGLRLDPDWSAAVVVVPGDPNLWCVGPDGGWWTLDSDVESLIAARQAHRAEWIDAVQLMHDQVPARIAAAERAADAMAELREQPSDAENQPDEVGEPEAPKRFSREWIEERAARYSYADDSDARAAGESAVARGHYTREEFLTVVRWKSARALPKAERNTAEEIEKQTSVGLTAVTEIARMEALVRLAGVGVPIASALLHFAYPDQYPILDYRALASLGDPQRRTTYSNAYWDRYLKECREIAALAGVDMRELDKALWQDSKEQDGHPGPKGS